MNPVETPQSRNRVGIARVDITPPVGIYHRMWGAATHDRSTGIHRPLTATALVIAPLDSTSTDDCMVIVAVDHCLLWGREMNALLQKLVTATGLPAERLIVAFSHTHGAGLMGTERVDLPGGELIPPYLDTLAERLAAVIAEARARVVPATMIYGAGHCTLAAHRDLWDDRTLQWVCGFHPGAPADDTVGIVKIVDDQHRTLGTVVNYACHPTTLAWDNTLISPDYIGAMREVIEQATDAPCVFLQGASGDLGPRNGFVGDTAVADCNGRQLGYSAMAAIEALPPPLTHHEFRGPVISGATIGVWQHTPIDETSRARLSDWSVERLVIELPLRAELPRPDETRRQIADLEEHEKLARERGDETIARDDRAQIERLTRWLVRLGTLPAGDNYPLQATLLRLGGSLWLFLESEHYQRLQTTLRRRFGNTPLVIATIANGSVHTYLPGREVYGTGTYQETVSILEPGCLETVIDTLGEQLGRMLKQS